MKQPTPRVSIGMPVYNGQRYLDRTIASILSQSFADFELIVSDNASTDDTETICRRWAARDRRIRYERLSRNVGAAANYNHVFRRARAPYFKWAPHDDLYEPTYLARCVETLDSDSGGIVLCYTRTMLIDEDDRLLGPYEDHTDIRDPAPSQRLLHLLNIPGNWCHAIVGVIRTEALRRTRLIGPYAGSDNILLTELVLQGRFFEIPEPLFLRRVHKDSSLGADPTPEEIAAWFDPRNEGRAVTHRLTRLKEQLRAVHRAHLPFQEKQRCYVALWQARKARQWTWATCRREILRACKKNLWDRFTAELASRPDGNMTAYRIWALASGLRRRDTHRIRVAFSSLGPNRRWELLDLAARSLSGRRDPHARRVLDQWLNSSSRPHRNAAARALGIAGPECSRLLDLEKPAVAKKPMRHKPTEGAHKKHSVSSTVRTEAS